MNKNAYCVIMAGGIGNRFWPVSNKRCPKQFCDILDTGKSFIRQTYERVCTIFPPDHIYIITGNEYENITRQQIPELPTQNILKEPLARNTATCIAYSSYKIAGISPDATIVTLPSDHFITNDDAYRNDINAGIKFVEQNGGLLTFGITPSRVETEYGYIQVKSRFDESQICQVKTFTEKPDIELATTFFESGDFLWNAGMFIWRLKDIIKEFKAHMFDLHMLFNTDSQLNTLKEQEFINDIYGQCTNTSIDVGIMEHSSNVYVLKGKFGWSDVGTWHAFHALNQKDENNNVANTADVIFQDSKDCILNVSPCKKVFIQGVENLIIAEKDNYLMVCNRKDENKIKHFEKQLRLKK